MSGPRMATVTCGGCGKTGRTPADQIPPGTVPLCPDCEPDAAEILHGLGFANPRRVAGSLVNEDGAR